MINKLGSIKWYILLAIVNFSCLDEKNKGKLYKTYKICDSLFLETYVVFGGGAYGGDLHSNYVTDSTHFRLFLGTEDTGKELIYAICNDDSLIVKKSANNSGQKSKVVFRKTYSVKQLIKEGKFE